jgi:hypothetical protein
MAGDADNIIVGAAEISIDGADIGFTKGGTTVRYEPEFLDVFADQAVGVVRKARTAERLFIVTTMLEVTLTRLRQAFMQPTNHLAGSTLTIGYNDACWVEELAIVLTGQSPGCGTRTFTFSKCVSMGTKEYNMQRDEETAFEVEFEALKDADGEFGTIVDS